MDLKTFVYRYDNKIFTFFVDNLPEGGMQVVGLHLSGKFHLFEHPKQQPRSADRFDTVDYRRLIAKAKSKFGVGTIDKHRVELVITKNGRDLDIRAIDPAGVVERRLVEDAVFAIFEG